MVNKRFKASRGSTLTELIIVIAITVIVVLAVGIALVDSQRGWSIMYNRIYSDTVTDSYVARRKFDTVMRKASARRKFDTVMRKASGESFLLDDTGSWLEVYYYADEDSAVVDRYARFYVANGDLIVEYGQLNPKVTQTVETVCGNVSGCTFKQAGRSAQMILTLDNGEQNSTVVSSAVTHN